MRNPGFSGRLNDLGVNIWQSRGGESDDEELLAFQSSDDGRLVLVVNGDGFDAGRYFVLAAFAR